MESAEGYVYFAESNAVASAEQVRAHTKPTSPDDHDRRKSAFKTSRAIKRRRVVHFEDSDDEHDDDVLEVGGTEPNGTDGGRAEEDGSTGEEARVGPSSRRLSHLADTSGTEGSPITPTAARLSDNRSLSPSLFISEVGGPTSPRQRSHLTSSSNNIPNPPDMDGLNRARAIKAEISINISVLQPQDAKPNAYHKIEEDPENQLIKTLRQDENMTWADIAAFLNQERRNRSEAATFTPAAVYSSFVRAAPRIATAVGEIGFDPKDYMHLRHPNQFAEGTNGAGGTSKAGKKRVKNFDNAKELDANVRKHLDEEGHEELETVERTEQLVNAVAKVERNFWVLVADEMERMTTKMYRPNELAGRYHAI